MVRVSTNRCEILLSPWWVVKSYERAAHWLRLAPANYEDVAFAVTAPWTAGRACHIKYDGVGVHAWLVLKCNSNGVDANMESLLTKGGYDFVRTHRLSAMNTSANTSFRSVKRHVSFAVVRDPMEHFISGYSESVNYRLADLESTSPKRRALGEMLRDMCATGAVSYACVPNPTRRAAAFVRDYIQTRTNSIRRRFQTTHANNQASFLCMHQNTGRTIIGADYVIYLDEMAYGWDRLGVEAGLSNWPTFQPDLFKSYRSSSFYHGTRPHNRSDAFSWNVHREAMKEVLKDKSYCRAVCSVLLVDYVCFKFPLPWCCATASQFLKFLRCPFKVGTFLGSSTLRAEWERQRSLETSIVTKIEDLLTEDATRTAATRDIAVADA